MNCISVSYKNAELEIRRKVGFTAEECIELSSKLIGACVTECVILSTCNRTEIYYCGDKSAEEYIIEEIAQRANMEASLLSKYIMRFGGDNAVIHLFKVASGIESMVIGEDEILGQTKKAYQSALENNAVSYELNMTFQAAIACAKLIKTETALSKTSVSVATLTANEAASLGDNVNVLVIGASGKIGMTIIKNLVSHKNVSVKATLRSNRSHLRLIESLGVETVDYKDRYKYIDSSDCVISATSSPHYTVTLYDLRKKLTERRNRLFIDLAVPPDIDSAAAGFEGARLINIDYFENAARENNILKRTSVIEAEEIISAEVSKLKKDMLFHEFLPILPDIKRALSDKSIEDIIYKMKSDSTSQVFESFLNVLKQYGS